VGDRREYSHRAELTLYRRSRRGSPDALQAVLHRGADRWYTAALMACGDEQSAGEAVARTWRTLLENLSGWRFGGGLESRAERLLVHELSTHIGYHEAHRAVRRSRQMEDEEVIALPVERIDELLACIADASERIAAAHQARVRALRIARLALGAVVAYLVAVAVWSVAIGNRVSVTQVSWECLQQRVVAQDLAGVLADVMSEFSVSEDQSPTSAQALQQAGLVLEEIANAQAAGSLAVMRRVGQRSRAEGLSGEVQVVAQRLRPEMRSELMRAALVLEEVENW
jgi:hypothetical protein